MPKRKPVENKHRKKPATAKRLPRAKVTAATFPAPATVPGQSKSRAAFDDLQNKREKCSSWWNDFMRLTDGDAAQWRISAYIAWASSPYKQRWPETLKDLCAEVLKCSPSRLHRLRRMHPEIEQRIAQEQVAPLMLHRRDVLDALIDVASTHDPSAHSDRKLFLEMAGDYKPKSALALTGENGGPIQTLELSELSKLDDAELDQFIANLETAVRCGPLAAPAAAGEPVARSAAVDTSAPPAAGA
jgi:hypothetical protein